MSAGTETFEREQESWLGPREAFEGLWDHGRRLVYAALNAGGMGTEGRYGPFCLVVPAPESPTPDALAVFPGNTAERYSSGGVVDEVAAGAEATSWVQRSGLAVEERGPEALAVPDEEWLEVVCRPDRYLEVARAGRLPVASVNEVRMRAGFVREIDDLQARSLRGQALDAEQRNLVAAYGPASLAPVTRDGCHRGSRPVDDMTVTLVCMAPSGETFITRNDRGLFWLHQPVGAGGAGPVDEATARIAVADHGFDRVERQFESWEALDRYRLERAARVAPAGAVDRETFDLHDVHRLLGVAEEWAAGGDQVGARELVFELLKVPAVREDDATYERLLGFLSGLVRTQPITAPLPSDPRKIRAREAWKQAA